MSPREKETALRWVDHVRECVRAGVSVEALKAKLAVTQLYLKQLNA